MTASNLSPAWAFGLFCAGLLMPTGRPEPEVLSEPVVEIHLKPGKTSGRQAA